jgi:RNA polymerase sigma-B factor
VQVGYLGLIQAIDRFDPGLGMSLPGYAWKTVEGEIMHLFRDQGWAVHVPRRLQELSRELAVWEEELTQRLGRRPSEDELARQAGVSAELVREAEAAARAYSVGSVDAVIDAEDEGLTILRFLGGEDPGFSLVDDKDALSAAIRRLPVRQQRLIRLRFEEELTQSEIAAELGISQMHVSRLLHDALEKLHDSLAGEYTAA